MTRYPLFLLFSPEKPEDAQNVLRLSLSKDSFFDKLSKFFERLKCIKMFEKLVD